MCQFVCVVVVVDIFVWDADEGGDVMSPISVVQLGGFNPTSPSCRAPPPFRCLFPFVNSTPWGFSCRVKLQIYVHWFLGGKGFRAGADQRLHSFLGGKGLGSNKERA